MGVWVYLVRGILESGRYGPSIYTLVVAAGEGNNDSSQPVMRMGVARLSGLNATLCKALTK